MSVHKRKREIKRRAAGSISPFASMRADAILHMVLTHKKHAVRCWWLGNAAWLPGKGSLVEGRAILPYSHLIRPVQAKTNRQLAPLPSHHTITTALKELHKSGCLPRMREGTKPSFPGGSGGLAAEYAVPSRHGSDAPPLQWPEGIPRPQGKVRIPATRMRWDAAELSPVALALLLYAVAHQHRDRHGALVNDKPFPLLVETLAGFLGVSPATVLTARNQLVAQRKIIEVEKASGRRPAMFKLAKIYTKHYADDQASEGLPSMPMVSS